jgi:hypothetical protein
VLMAAVLARMPDLRHRVHNQHSADHNWCCSECGDQVRWPCDLHQIATEAERIATGQPSAPLPGRFTHNRLPQL